MAGNISDQTTCLSNLSLTHNLAASRISSAATLLVNEIWGSTISGAFQARAGTVLAPTYAFGSEVSLGFYRSAASSIALSYGTISLNMAALVSVRTIGTGGSSTSTGVSPNELVFQVHGASGASMILRSGSANTIWIWNSAVSSAGTVT